MATVTPNFGWDVPQSTDLVKDGATAIAALGNDIDTSLVDLKGGTTGQVLSKASNSDMDFTWVAQDDSNAIQNALLTTTGDTIYASGASTPARLGIGSTGQVLTVSGGLPVWATPSSGSMTLLSTTTLSSTSTSISSISGSYNSLFLIIYGVTAGANNRFRLAPNGATNLATYGVLNGATGTAQTATYIRVSEENLLSTGALNVWNIQIHNYASTASYKPFAIDGNYQITGPSTRSIAGGGALATTSAITSLTFDIEGATFNAGTVLLYGVK